MTIKQLFTIVLLGWMHIVNAQDKNLSAKFNFGMSFSKPGGDLGKVVTKGKAMQLFTSAEAGYHLSFSKNTHFGVKVVGVAGSDYANFFDNNRSTEIKVSAPNIRARIYPFSNNGDLDEELEKTLPSGLPFLIEIPVWITIYTFFNSLHFDYGVEFGKILETAPCAIFDGDFSLRSFTPNLKNGWSMPFLILENIHGPMLPKELLPLKVIM